MNSPVRILALLLSIWLLVLGQTEITRLSGSGPPERAAGGRHDGWRPWPRRAR
jgi:hypothetical protein